jgi:hypothetical protein
LIICGKPEAETVIVCKPAGTLVSVNLPLLSVVVDPPAYDTFAPETALHDGFFTRPVIEPVPVADTVCHGTVNAFAESVMKVFSVVEYVLTWMVFCEGLNFRIRK